MGDAGGAAKKAQLTAYPLTVSRDFLSPGHMYSPDTLTPRKINPFSFCFSQEKFGLLTRNPARMGTLETDKVWLPQPEVAKDHAAAWPAPPTSVHFVWKEAQ